MDKRFDQKPMENIDPAEAKALGIAVTQEELSRTPGIKMLDWSEYFDRIYGLSLADNIERRKEAVDDWKRLGITDNTYFENIFEWKITVRNPFYKYIWTNPSLPAEKWWLNLDNALNCTMGHYEIMKQALALGYKRILILEDDCRFHNNPNVVLSNLNNLPEYDICLFDLFSPMPRDLYNRALTEDRVNSRFFSFSNVKLWSCACYALSEKAMRSITEELERHWIPADSVTNRVDNFGRPLKEDDLIRIAAVENSAVQDFKGKTYNTISDYAMDLRIYDGIADRTLYNVKAVNPEKRIKEPVIKPNAATVIKINT